MTPTFRPIPIWRKTGISDDHPQRNTLILLLATCEVALERFGGADAQVDDKLVRDLEQLIARTRTALSALDS